MKTWAILAGSASLLLLAAAVEARVPTVTLNEYGVGTFTDEYGYTEDLTSSLASDPSGRSNVLRYFLPVSAPTVGDLHLLTPPGGPGVSDVIRFTPGGVLYFYSGGDANDSWNTQADGELPQSQSANTLVRVRGSNTFSYTPTIGQPGFDPGGFVVTYNIVTEVSPIPEPASLVLMGLGGTALLLRRKRA